MTDEASAECQDCHATEAGSLDSVAEWADRHERKEVGHDVKIDYDVAPDGGDEDDEPIDVSEWFVVEELESNVVGGPFDRRALAVEEASDCGGSHAVYSAGALELLELTSKNANLSWEIERPDDD